MAYGAASASFAVAQETPPRAHDTTPCRRQPVSWADLTEPRQSTWPSPEQNFVPCSSIMAIRRSPGLLAPFSKIGRPLCFRVRKQIGRSSSQKQHAQLGSQERATRKGSVAIKKDWDFETKRANKNIWPHNKGGQRDFLSQCRQSLDASARRASGSRSPAPHAPRAPTRRTRPSSGRDRSQRWPSPERRTRAPCE